MDEQGRFENSLLRGIEERAERYGRRWPTGWFELDDLTGGGVERGRVTVVTGPEELRRAVTGSIALWGAAAGATTLLVGLQETPEQLQVRCVTSATGLTAEEVVRPDGGWAGARRAALDEILRRVTLRAMTPSSMMPSHQLSMMQVELLVADDPWADMGALSTSLSAGPGWQRGTGVEDSLRHYAALSRSAVVTSGAATRMGRWRPHLRIDITEPRRPGAGTTARVRRRGHEDVHLDVPFAMDPDGVHRLPQPGPAAGWPDPPPPLALLDDRAAELLAAQHHGAAQGQVASKLPSATGPPSSSTNRTSPLTSLPSTSMKSSAAKSEESATEGSAKFSTSCNDTECPKSSTET